MSPHTQVEGHGRKHTGPVVAGEMIVSKVLFRLIINIIMKHQSTIHSVNNHLLVEVSGTVHSISIRHK